MDSYDCGMVLQPLLMIENSQQQRQTAAAVESFRNEMVVANQQMLAVASVNSMNKDRPLYYRAGDGGKAIPVYPGDAS